MLTEKDYCDYETCVALTKIGFPLWDLPYEMLSEKYRLRLYDAQKWLREAYNLHIEVRLHGIIGYQYEVLTPEGTIAVGREFLTYEEALSEGIKDAVKILKEK